jgi:hypothetical protein
MPRLTTSSRPRPGRRSRGPRAVGRGARLARHVPLRGIDRGGATTTGDGVVRVLELTPLPQLASGPDELAPVLGGIAALLGELEPGELLQWYVDARPVPVEELLDAPAAPAERAPHEALAQLASADARRLGSVLAEPAALERTAHLVVRPAARGVGAFERSLERAEAFRAALEQAGLRARLLDGPAVSRLILRRLAAHPPGRGLPRAEVVDATARRADRRRAAVAAARLLDGVRETAIDFADARHVRIGADVEQTLSVDGLPHGEAFDWLAALRPAALPSALSVHVRAAARGELRIAAYLTIRAPDSPHDAVALATVVDDVVREAAAGGVRVNRGEFLQRTLWTSTLPLAIDAAHVEHPADAATIAAASPIADAGCGSPSGVPFARGAHGRLERLDPWDVAHDEAGVLVAGGDAAARAQALLPLLVRLAARGTVVAVLDGEHALADAEALLGEAVERVEAGDPLDLLTRPPADGPARLLIVDPAPEARLLPLAGATVALLHERAGALGGDLDDDAPPALGALVVTGAERLLADPGGGAWLRLVAAGARRRGCATILLADSAIAVAVAEAELLELLPVRVLLAHGPTAAGDVASLFGLVPREARMLAGAPDAPAERAPSALWLNGARGRAYVRLLDLLPMRPQEPTP